jgi:hypothetical protein
MPKISLLFLTILLVLAIQSPVISQTPNLTGTWVMNKEKSKIEDPSEGMTGSIFKIKQEGNKFRIKIYHIYGEKEKKIGFKMKADGRTRKVKLIFKGKLEQKENSLTATMWRKNYLNIVNYKFGANENELIADEVFTGRPRDHHSVWVFDREVVK